MAEWLFEAGLGEDRAILIKDGKIIEARIELPGLRAGTTADARLTEIMLPGRRGIATLASGEEVLIEPLPRHVTKGALVRIEIVREAGTEAGAVKRAKGRATDRPLSTGPSLADRILNARHMTARDPDLFEEAGWSECIEQATRGAVQFPGGMLRISMTPAMTLIDVDGELPAFELGQAGARAAGYAIRRFDIAGNIGIDLPTVGGKDERAAIARALDEVLPQPFERTAVNGFGFLQVVRPKQRNSLPELLASDPIGAATRSVLRKAQRSGIIGAARLVVSVSVASRLSERHASHIEALARSVGGKVSVRVEGGLAMHAAFVEASS